MASGDARDLAAVGLAAAELAHELRNVLATIALSAHAGARSPDDSARFLARIAKHAELGQRLVEDVLALAQGGVVAREPTLVTELLASARDSLDTPATFVDEIDVPSISVHRVLFGRLLHALYANAAEVGLGQAQIVTRVHATAEGIFIDVGDDGPGVPASLRSSLFEAFASARAGGTGLGLALAARIAEAHGGLLTLRDDTPSTTFRIALPAP